MNKKNLGRKGEKGITLVALIITIIVLLILAVVAIKAVQGDGIIQHAKNARDEYEQAQTNEQTTLEGYLGTIESNLPNGSGAEVEPISVETDCIKYYADVNGDKEPDGIIYIDKAKTVSGSWQRSYSYTITNVTTGLKEYYISKESHTTTEFGTAPVLSLVPGSTGEERFYVMALNDEKKTIEGKEYSIFYWYYNAFSNGISEYSTLTKTGVGEGKINTSNMLTAWNATTPTYGAKHDRDMWNVVKDGWYVPSKDEWAAFASAFKVTSSNYPGLGLSGVYWSSSLYDSYNAWNVFFSNGVGMSSGFVNSSNFVANYCVRLGTTF